MTDISLQPDCSQCAALCCMAFAFEKSAEFAIDKPACTPCPNLEVSGTCSVYEERASLGFHGCIAHNCLGAGQHVTQQLFGGRHWRDDKALLQPMSEAFSAMVQIHKLLELLMAAEALPLTAAEQASVMALHAMLSPPEGWTEASLKAANIDDMKASVRAFLASLKHHVERAV